MPSPFPGMDPYLEPHWQSIHTLLVTYAYEALNDALPEGLVACVEERVAIEADDRAGHTVGRIGPDVRVSHLRPAEPAPVGPVVIDAPYVLQSDPLPTLDRHVTIVDEVGRLVTVIEFVSPANKRLPGLARFRRNRDDLLEAGAHFVEIDLVREGNWRRLMRPERCPPAAVSSYRAVVRTAGDDGRSYLFPIGLRDPLPAVPIPLRPGDQPMPLSLQPLIDRAYDRGRWAARIDYGRPPRPPLRADDAAWAAALLAGRGSA